MHAFPCRDHNICFLKVMFTLILLYMNCFVGFCIVSFSINIRLFYKRIFDHKKVVWLLLENDPVDFPPLMRSSTVLSYYLFLKNPITSTAIYLPKI